MAHLQVPITDFLQSECLSNSIVFLQHEDDGATTTQAAAQDDSKIQQRRLMENAVRVAFYLTRSFIHCSQLSEFSDKNNDLQNLSSIQLADFFIDFEQHDVTSEVEHTDGLHQSNEPSKKTVILRIGKFSRTEIDFLREQQQLQQKQQIHSQATPMQILGRLLYSFFSQGQSPGTLIDLSSDKVVGAAASLLQLNEGVANSPNSRTSQRSRTTEISVFSQLVDSKAFPLSVCRLLSDMIDSGPRGKADTPFASFRDVMQDLDDMISRPRIFLHDSYFPHHAQQTPVFGRVFRGRREEVRSLIEISDKMEESLQHESNTEKDEDFKYFRLETVFVSGIAGSGKSHLIQAVGETLQSFRWIVTKAKFEHGKSYASGGIVASMFDKVIMYLVEMKEKGDSADIAYCDRVSKSILDSIGRRNISGLIGFLPSLSLLLNDIGGGQDIEMHSGGQLVHSLSKVLEAVLEPNRFIMIIADDLQWADKSSLSLISEVLINVGGVKHISRRCMFVGLFRHDEIDDHHPFSIQHSYLQMSSYVNTTEMKLSGLSRNDIVDMLMSELKLPRRLVADLADVVYKKTLGHAIFVLELLNSLLNESIVAYSSQKHSFTWDPDRIDFIQTSENAAELIASNLNSLSPKSQLGFLQTLSCFGIETDVSLLRVLENFQEGIMSSLKEFVDRGILSHSWQRVMFNHDLILQAVYEGMPLAKRQSLHLEIGKHLGASAIGSQVDLSLISLACDQVNFARVDSISDEDQQVKFAKWNLSTGRKMMQESKFTAALHYYEKGISFLGKECWWKDLQLSSRLHECSVMAAFALGEADTVMRYAEVFMEHALLRETLKVQVVVLRSLFVSGKIEEGIYRGFKILRQLGFNIPASPTDETVMNAMSNTENTVSKYSIDDIVNMCEKFSDESSHSIIKVFDVLFDFCWASGSHLSSLLTCESIKYSLQHGVCIESATTYAIYARIKIANEGDFMGGKRLAGISRAIIENYRTAKKATSSTCAIRALSHLYCFIDIWFISFKEIATKLITHSDEAIQIGLVDDAIVCLMEGWSLRLYGGEKLSVIFQASLQRFQRIAKQSQHFAKWAVCDCVLLMELTGKSEDYFSALEGGSIYSLDDIQVEAESSNIYLLTYRITVTNLLRSYWRGDYVSAEKCYKKALTKSFSKSDPKTFIFHLFFGGLISFRLYRTLGDDGRLNEGKEILDKVGKWAQNSTAVFGNKWLLLKAEHTSSINEKRDSAEQLYKDSIKAAQDHGYTNELALAYELLGEYYASKGRHEDSKTCFKKAFVYYTEWGATMVAERLLRNHDFDIFSLGNI